MSALLAQLRAQVQRLLDRSDGDWKFVLAEAAANADEWRRELFLPAIQEIPKRRWRRRIAEDAVTEALAPLCGGDRKLARRTATAHLDVDPDNVGALADAMRAAVVDAFGPFIREEARAWRVARGLPPDLDEASES